MSKTPPPTTTTSKPYYPPEATSIFAGEKSILQNFQLPAEQQQISALSALGRGDITGATPALSILSPALSAGKLAQAQLSARLSGANLPGNVTGPLEEGMAQKVGRIPYGLEAGAPDQLQQLVQALIGPQFGALFAPGSRGKTSGGGPSDLQTGLSAAGVAAAVAAIAATAFSSERFKDDIATLTGSLDTILALRPVSFTYRDETYGAGPQVGLIAEEVAALDSRCVMNDQHDLPLAIRYGAIAALLVQAFKEMYAMLTAQQKAITHMQEQYVTEKSDGMALMDKPDFAHVLLEDMRDKRIKHGKPSHKKAWRNPCPETIEPFYVAQDTPGSKESLKPRKK